MENVKTRTRTVQETEWWPLSGVFRKYYSGYMVSASKGLPQNEAVAIQPYRLSSMMRFRPHFLAGWMLEEYSFSRDEAMGLAKSEFMRREKESIAQFLPGDTHSNLSVFTNFEEGDTDLVLLPVHVMAYHYRGQVYRFLVNGQTGKVYGEKALVSRAYSHRRYWGTRSSRHTSDHWNTRRQCGGITLMEETRCRVCRSFLDPEDLFCSNCGTENLQGRDADGVGIGDTSTLQTIASVMSFQCDQCGASMSYDASAQQLRCPFCGSESLTSRPTARTIRPKSVVPFRVQSRDVEGLIRKWLSEGFGVRGCLNRFCHK